MAAILIYFGFKPERIRNVLNLHQCRYGGDPAAFPAAAAVENMTTPSSLSIIGSKQ